MIPRGGSCHIARLGETCGEHTHTHPGLPTSPGGQHCASVKLAASPSAAVLSWGSRFCLPSLRPLKGVLTSASQGGGSQPNTLGSTADVSQFWPLKATPSQHIIPPKERERKNQDVVVKGKINIALLLHSNLVLSEQGIEKKPKYNP